MIVTATGTFVAADWQSQCNLSSELDANDQLSDSDHSFGPGTRPFSGPGKTASEFTGNWHRPGGRVTVRPAAGRTRHLACLSPGRTSGSRCGRAESETRRRRARASHSVCH